MGTKIKLILIFIVTTNCVLGQNSKIDILKRYALYKCINSNYSQIDTAFISHDYTASYIFQIKSIDYTLLNQIDEYIEKGASNYYKNPIAENLDDKKANYVCWYCIEFYESKELDNYIKNILRKNNVKK